MPRPFLIGSADRSSTGQLTPPAVDREIDATPQEGAHRVVIAAALFLPRALIRLASLYAPMFEIAPDLAMSSRIAVVEGLESRELLSTTWYVSTTGSNSNSGSEGAPFQTIQQAAQVAEPGDTVDIFGGTYNESVTPAHSGVSGAPITYQSVPGQTAVIDGAESISGWKQYSGSIYVASDPYDLGFGNNQVFDNGQAMVLAQWPNTSLDLNHPTVAYAQGGYGGTLTDSALASSGINWTGATIHILAGSQWVGQTATVTSDSGSTITFNLANMGDPEGQVKGGSSFYLTGKFQALDGPGEWYVDNGSLYLWAPNGGVPQNVQVKARQYGFNLNGRSDINLNNISLFGCSIVGNGANGCTVNGITAEYVSQSLLQSNGWNIADNSGIVFSGYGNTVQWSTVEYSSGDGIMMFGSNNYILNNTVTGCDYDAYDNAGIRTIGSSDTIQDNVVSDCGRDGIKFSNTTSTLVVGNTVFDVMLQATDGGGIYTYGTSGYGSLIANNRVYNVYAGGYGAAGLYLDNGSYGFTVENNTVYDTNIGIKMNPPSYNETIEGNTLLGNMQSVASYGSEDMSGSKFVNNVFDNVLQIKGSVTIYGNTTVSQSYVPNYPSLAVPNISVFSSASAPITETHVSKPQTTAAIGAVSTSTPSAAPPPAPSKAVTPTPAPTTSSVPLMGPILLPALLSSAKAAAAVVSAPLTHGQLVALSLKESASDSLPIAYDALPAVVTNAFKRANAGRIQTAYYEFTAGGQTFYSVHFGRASKEREFVRVNSTGRVVSRQFLNGAAARADGLRSASAKN